MTAPPLRWIAGASVLCLSLTAAVAIATPPLPGGVASLSGPGESTQIGVSDLTPPRYERDVARLVGQNLQRYHYTVHALDDEISSRWFDNYLERLDYQRMIFLQSDVDAFSAAYRETMDDGLEQRPALVEAGVVIYERYRERMRARVIAAQHILEAGVDLTDQESWVPMRHDHELPWPTTEAEANELWRKRIEDEFIVGLIDGQTQEEISERLTKRYERYLRSLDDVESTDVLETWLGALGAAYDPHSTWFKPATNDDFDIEITNSVSGIGAQLRSDGEFTEIVEIITGGPAFKSKRLLPEDQILAVAQGDEEPVDVVGQRIDRVVALIRGEVGTEVRLHIRHADGEREIVSMLRDRVTLEASAAEEEIHEIDGHKLGVIDLPSFYVDPTGDRDGRRASSDVKAALRELRSQGAEGLILDLRGNGGGSLIEAIDVAGLFLTSGPIVQVRSRTGEIEALHDSDPQVHWLAPMVVLTDPTSASASEIVAGALQDYGRALVVGSHHTHGKGTVQQVAPLTPMLPGRHTRDVGGALKLTIQKFYRVSGSSTQNKGVESDIVLPSRWDGLDIYESNLSYALPWDRIPPAPHVRIGDPTKALDQLKSLSSARVSNSEDFVQLERLLEEREALKLQDEVSLVLSERRAEHEARQSRAGTLEDQGHSGIDQPEEDDFILDEALSILKDLIDVGR
ncbi:MAG TPA: tail-specific protease [Deltaproteobacteria bacterium]|nr:tail-specific protease [Deltaproteobacteria bacterium]